MDKDTILRNLKEQQEIINEINDLKNLKNKKEREYAIYNGVYDQFLYSLKHGNIDEVEEISKKMDEANDKLPGLRKEINHLDRKIKSLEDKLPQNNSSTTSNVVKTGIIATAAAAIFGFFL